MALLHLIYRESYLKYWPETDSLLMVKKHHHHFFTIITIVPDAKSSIIAHPIYVAYQTLQVPDLIPVIYFAYMFYDKLRCHVENNPYKIYQ